MLDRLMPGTGSKLAKIGQEQPFLEEALSSRPDDGKLTEVVKLLMLHSDDSKGSTDRLIEKLTPLVEQENRKHGSAPCLLWRSNSGRRQGQRRRGPRNHSRL